MNRFRLLLLSILCVASATSGLQAQKNPYEKIAVTGAKARTLATAANRAVRSSTPTAAERRAIRDYVLKCGIAPIGAPSTFASDGRTLAKFRKVVVDMLRLSGAQSPAAHAEIVALCEKYLIVGDKRNGIPGIATSNSLPPASRLNAMLLVADLNTTEGKRTAPKPSAKAGAFMTTVVGSKKYPQYLRIAALNGLRRHAACGAIKSSKTLQAVAGILKEQPASDMQPEALIWQRRLAIETLGLMKAPVVAKYVAPILLDKDAPLELRCAAAEALGRLKFQAGSKTVANAIAPVGAVAVAACLKEVERMDAEIKLRLVDGAAPAPVNIGAEGKEAPIDPIVDVARRVLLNQLNCVATGIEGLSAAATGQHKNLAGAVAGHLKELQKLLTDDARTMPPEELQGQIATTASKLKRIVVTN